MKKYIALLLCLIMTTSMISCTINHNYPPMQSWENTENTTAPVQEEKTTAKVTEESSPSIIQVVQNERARQAYARAIKNQTKLYYSLFNSSTPNETYFEYVRRGKGNPTKQSLIDMDKDGIEELILLYSNFLILLHFENDAVYATDFNLDSMETIYTDGSFSWRRDSDIFGDECGVGRISFVNGKLKYQELYRMEGDSKFYINGAQVSNEQYKEYVDSSCKTPIKFTSFDIYFLDPDEIKAIEIACEYWGIKDGDFDSETGYRYRVICTGKSGNLYRVSLYLFVKNSYYEHLEIALVNVDTAEVSISQYPDGKG